jgi:hypothetical protein
MKCSFMCSAIRNYFSTISLLFLFYSSSLVQYPNILLFGEHEFTGLAQVSNSSNSDNALWLTLLEILFLCLSSSCKSTAMQCNQVFPESLFKIYALGLSKFLISFKNTSINSTRSSILLVAQFSITIVKGYLSRFCWYCKFLSMVMRISNLFSTHYTISFPFFTPLQFISFL